MKKLISILVAFAMAAMLSITAFAADGTTDAGTPWGTAANSKLVKYLQAGEGVAVPENTVFNFTITNQANANDVINVAIPFKGSTEPAVRGMTADANNDYIGYKTIAEIFTGYTFPAAGEYVYDVVEVAASGTVGDNEDLTINNNGSSYVLHIYVKNGTSGPEIDKVSVQNEDNEKVDPTEIKDTADEGTVNNEDQGFAFTNTFKKDLVDPDQGEDTQDLTGIIDVTKTVTGDYGDKTYEFPFELAYTLPAANQGAVKYKVLPKGTTNAAAIEEETADGSPIRFKLKDGDKLIITQAPQGTKWSTVEKLATCTDLQNRASYQASVNKYGAYEEGKTAFDKGANAQTSQQLLTAADSVAYTNALDASDVTPTGILINNLPYIALALVAIGGLVAYVVVRRRQNDEA